MIFRFAASPYLYLLLLIPLLAVLRYWWLRQEQSLRRRIADQPLQAALAPRRSRARRAVKFWLLKGSMAALILMLARPQYGERTVTEGKGGIEVALMLDVSNSMLARDVAPNRLERARLLLSNLLDRMDGDKVSFGIFAGEAYPQLPLTSDLSAAKMQLAAAQTSMVTLQGTDLAAAIRLGCSAFSDREVGKALVVITDGEDHLGEVEDAAKTCRDAGVTLFLLGVGTPQGATIPQRNGPLTDAEGHTVLSRLNEEMCRKVAEAAGGHYLHVDNSSHAQEQLLEAFRQMPQAEQEFQTTEVGEQYQAFGLIALILLTLSLLIFEGKITLYTRLGLFKKKSRS